MYYHIQAVFRFISMFEKVVLIPDVILQQSHVEAEDIDEDNAEGKAESHNIREKNSIQRNVGDTHRVRICIVVSFF